MEQSSHRFNSYTFGIAFDGQRRPEGAMSFEDLIRDKVLDFEFDLLDLVRDFPAGMQFEALLDLINKRMLRVQNAIRFSLQIEQLTEYPDQRGLSDGRHFESKQKAQEFQKRKQKRIASLLYTSGKSFKANLKIFFQKRIELKSK